MHKITATLLFSVIIILSIVIVALIAEISISKNQAPVIQFVERTRVEYYFGLDLNKEVQQLIEGGGMQQVLDFFDSYTNNSEITTAILNEALDQEVPVVTAFSLAWGESRYNPQSINNNGNRSTDWGLFQLNDSYRQDWSRADFFDVDKNTKEGLSYFSYSMRAFSTNVVLSIAGYNKGVENIKNRSAVPYSTLAHINNIIEYERDLERELNIFISEIKNEW